MDENAFLAAIKKAPGDGMLRLVYADWLEERGDARSGFLRLHHALRSLSPDHVWRFQAEQELSRLRQGLEHRWLTVVEPERAHLTDDPPRRPWCSCMEAGYHERSWAELDFHVEPQDTECDAWKELLDLVERTADDGREEFSPALEMDSRDWAQIVTLPPTIGKLKSVKHLMLYGSHLVRIPPEIEEMPSLEELDPYTSYRLHWFPYEITRCKNLRRSTVSTRALYGNYKYRPPFPRLEARAPAEVVPTGAALPMKEGKAGLLRSCSVCDQPFEDRQLHRVWISLRVATDVLPLLVNACSEECIRRLPQPPDGYVQGLHRGGLEVQQPPRRY
jgi:uncharacterized protein (TIGR02996 family)